MGSDSEGPSLGGPQFRPVRGASDGPGSAPGIGPGGIDADIIFLATVAAAPSPMVLSDPNRPDNPIVFANSAFLRMSGYDRAEVLGRNCRFLQGPGSDPDAVHAIRSAVRARVEVAVEILNYRKDGAPFWNALSVAPVFGPGGDILYFFACQLDVSRRRAAEEALSRAGMAGDTGLADGRGVGDVAHDIANMLQVVTGHAAALRDRAAASGDARLLRRLQAVVEAADRAAALTHELRDGFPGAMPGRVVLAGAGDATAPVAPAPSSAAAEARADRPEPDASAPIGGRILVVDDRAEVAELARTMLMSAGYAVEVAAGSRDALNRLEGGFDLLFSDLVMPGDLDGVGLAREAQRRDPRLRVLLTTGRASGPAGASTDRRTAGFETITKPYRRGDLVGTVRRLLGDPAERG